MTGCSAQNALSWAAGTGAGFCDGVCLPSGLKTLVIPIFLPIIPFISFKVYTIGYETEHRHTAGIPALVTALYAASIYYFNPCLQPTFSFRLPSSALRRSRKPEVPAVNKP